MVRRRQDAGRGRRATSAVTGPSRGGGARCAGRSATTRELALGRRAPRRISRTRDSTRWRRCGRCSAGRCRAAATGARSTSGRSAVDQPFDQPEIPGYRQIVDLSPANDSRFSDAVGQSGHFLSHALRQFSAGLACGAAPADADRPVGHRTKRCRTVTSGAAIRLSLRVASGFLGGFLISACRCQHAHHDGEVAFMAGPLVDLVVASRQREHRRP